MRERKKEREKLFRVLSQDLNTTLVSIFAVVVVIILKFIAEHIYHPTAK